jgi:hypothetical protein
MIIAKSQKDMEKMRAVGELIAEVREALREMVTPGISTLELNTIAEKMMRDAGSIPTFIGYAPHGMVAFPYAICASANEQIVHGFSTETPLKDGDIISLDMACTLDGLRRRYGDHGSGGKCTRRTQAAYSDYGRMSRTRHRSMSAEQTRGRHRSGHSGTRGKTRLRHSP